MPPQNATLEHAVIRGELFELVEHLRPSLNGGTNLDFYSAVADRLNSISGAGWKWKYIQSVLSGTVTGSQSLGYAVRALGHILDDGHPLLARAVPVSVFAVENVREGSIVLAASRACAYAGCRINFVPRTPGQRHCSRVCQVKNYRLRNGRP